MAKIYERLLFTNIPPRKKMRDKVDSRGQNMSAEDNTCLVDCLEIL